jgi:cytochrome c oxidase subunit 2
MSWRFIPVVLALGAGGCVRFDRQSALDPAGTQATSIRGLFLFMIVIAAIVYVIVVGTLFFIMARRSASEDLRSPEREAKARRVIGWSLVGTVIIAFALLVYDFAVGRSLMHPSSASYLSIRVTGHQWWWDVEYEDPIPQNRVHVANEIHIPVGRPVRIRLLSHDVIHSFWIPNLGGKRDLIPGHYNEQWLHADRPGVFRGQCAEFCGLQHAKMAMLVIAEPPEQFAAWVAQQRKPATTPADTLAARGRRVFEAGPCANCHTIAGTAGAGRVGPDLTHLMSRTTIAAGTLPNTAANLAGWIVDPQTLKPGAQMPANPLEAADLRALLAYLRTLR